MNKNLCLCCDEKCVCQEGELVWGTSLCYECYDDVTSMYIEKKQMDLIHE